MTLPQVRAMYGGDQSRKEVLVDYGFRLPSALDNRPLSFGEFEERARQVVYVSATPGPYEYEHSEQMVEQVIRPTGLSDPKRSMAGKVRSLPQREKICSTWRWGELSSSRDIQKVSLTSTLGVKTLWASTW